jgi:hypothetical protein
MESTGIPGKIQVSQSTATLLIAAGKNHWVEQREDQIAAKGKGKMQTYWAEPHTGGSNKSAAPLSVSTGSEPSGKPATVRLDDRTKRLVQWNVDVLLRLVKQIVARRECIRKAHKS